MLGVQLALPVTAKIDVVTEGDERVATGVAVGNLGDLQANAVPIAQAIPLPNQPCANPNGLNVVLEAIHSASITAEGDVARLAMVGTVTGYGCLDGRGRAGCLDAARDRRLRSSSTSPRRPISASSSQARSSWLRRACRPTSPRCSPTR